MNSHPVASPLQLLGVGSDKNRRLKAHLEEAMRQLNLNIAIEEVHDIHRMLEHQITGIPALLINGKVVFQREVPSVDDLKVVLNALLGEGRFLGSAERIVVPIDFSSASLNALDYAFALANIQLLPVDLVHVAADHSAQDRLQKLVRQLQASTRMAPQVEITGTLVEGAVGAELERFARNERMLIVMGSTGSHTFAPGWLGSVSRRVALQAACPVLLVPPQARYEGFQTMVYASGYHPAEESVLPKVADLASWYKARLYFVHVLANTLSSFSLNRNTSPPSSGYEGELVELAKVYSPNVVQGLLDFTRQIEADLLMVATSRRNLLERLIMPGTTQRVLKRLEIPLLVFHL